MDLTRELLLPYQGLDLFGLCHIRVYEQPGALPVVIAGGLDDNPGTSLTLAIEIVAATVQRSEFLRRARVPPDRALPRRDRRRALGAIPGAPHHVSSSAS
jgi:hypothetical protein